jgi:putative phosphoesterase
LAFASSRKRSLKLPGTLTGEPFMRVAAIYDIHSNLPALEAVLREIRDAKVDQIVAGGDVLLGPMPSETMLLLASLEIPIQFIFGNCESAVLEQIAGREPAAVPPRFRPLIQWTAEQLSEPQRLSVSTWPMTVRIEMPELGTVLFCHATPRSDNENFTRRTAEEKLLPIFEDTGANVVVCGHTHMQFDLMIGKIRVVNAGSVGMPFGKPGAYWLMLGPGIELRRTAYDFARAAGRIRATSYPSADEFVTRYILQPPSEEQALEMYSSAELK